MNENTTQNKKRGRGGERNSGLPPLKSSIFPARKNLESEGKHILVKGVGDKCPVCRNIGRSFIEAGVFWVCRDCGCVFMSKGERGE